MCHGKIHNFYEMGLNFEPLVRYFKQIFDINEIILWRKVIAFWSEHEADLEILSTKIQK